MTYASQSHLAVICLTAFLQPNVRFTGSFTTALILRFADDSCGEGNRHVITRPKVSFFLRIASNVKNCNADTMTAICPAVKQI